MQKAFYFLPPPHLGEATLIAASETKLRGYGFHKALWLGRRSRHQQYQRTKHTKTSKPMPYVCSRTCCFKIAGVNEKKRYLARKKAPPKTTSAEPLVGEGPSMYVP